MTKKAVFFGLMLAFLAGSGLAFASTNIDNCTTLNVTGETYLLTSDIIDSSDTSCMLLEANDTILDCQGNKIDGNFVNSAYAIDSYPSDSFYVVNITIKNCMISDYTYNAIDLAIESGKSGDFCNITNNTFMNIDGPVIYIQGGINNSISRNTFIGFSEGIYLDSSYNNSIFDNVFSDDVQSILDIIYGIEDYGLFYNNLLNFSADVPPDIIFNDVFLYRIWNTTRQIGTRIYSAGTEIGGNYWTNSTGTGYSDLCTDLLQDGFCDDPYDVEANAACAEVADGLPACGNNTDWLPLSAFYEEPPCVQNWTCTEWGECVRGYQNRVCTDENGCQNETGRPAERQLCLTPVPNATMNITQACCPISTLRCFDNSTLVEIWNTSAGVAYAFEDCPFGCDNATSSCAPKAFEQNLYLLGIFIFIVVAGLIAIKWAKR